MNSSRSFGRTRIVLRANTNRVVDPHVRQLAVLTELVDPPRADGQSCSATSPTRSRRSRPPQTTFRSASVAAVLRTGGDFSASWPFAPTPVLATMVIRVKRHRNFVEGPC